jgi:hypothetical protein
VDRYYRTDEEAEAADALLAALRFSRDIGSNLRQWRWTIIALHNAVQGFMVLSLRHGNGLLALSPKCMVAWLNAYEARTGRYPEEKLDTYLGLYAKVKSANHGAVGGNLRFAPRGSQGRSIRKLDELRNNFIHFTPKGWSLEVSGLPRIVLDSLSLVAFLGWETSNILWHDEQALRAAKSCHAQLLETMSRLENSYASTP